MGNKQTFFTRQELDEYKVTKSQANKQQIQVCLNNFIFLKKLTYLNEEEILK